VDISRITEIGVAVPDLDEATQLLVELLGADAGEVHEVERYAMRYRMCRVGKVDFELMEPTGESGVIADFLRKRGPGLHHVAFAVDNVGAGMAALGARGVRFVEELPVELRLAGQDFAGRCFDGEVKLTFAHPRSMLGVLFEFIEYPPGYATGRSTGPSTGP
jgi:methylmalonyl-CoA/ethylmalonyl-CoA epimerase